MAIPERPPIDTQRLRELYGSTGKQQQDLETETGLSHVTISKFFHGLGTYRTLFAVANFLEVDPRILLKQ